MIGTLMRAPSAWHELRYERATGADDDRYDDDRYDDRYDDDRHAAPGGLWALQYDRWPDDVAQWAANERSRFPADPAAAYRLRWAAGREWGRVTLGVLHYQLADLGRPRGRLRLSARGCGTPTLPGSGLAGVVFAEADRQARQVPALPPVVLRTAIEAAEKAGDQARAEHYRRLRDAEQRRIDAELGRTTA
ncbi:hypothetical protein ACN27F_11990 [Solwaraspora sp. WMMB335]|uniref:hypothetical protein n=1 Tax=Solwaraspora sp. WMMB335 TaxID=3404118 RepID=UPI003B929150